MSTDNNPASLPWSIVTALVVNRPLGLAAIYYSVSSQTKVSAGDDTGAAMDAGLARKLNLVGLVMMLTIVTAVVVMFAALVMFTLVAGNIAGALYSPGDF